MAHAVEPHVAGRYNVQPTRSQMSHFVLGDVVYVRVVCRRCSLIASTSAIRTARCQSSTPRRHEAVLLSQQPLEVAIAAHQPVRLALAVHRRARHAAGHTRVLQWVVRRVLLCRAGQCAAALQYDGARVVVVQVDVLLEREEVAAEQLAWQCDGLNASMLRRPVLLVH